MAKWWQHEAHPDTIERLADVSVRLEEATREVRDRLNLSSSNVGLRLEDPSRRSDT